MATRLRWLAALAALGAGSAGGAIDACSQFRDEPLEPTADAGPDAGDDDASSDATAGDDGASPFTVVQADPVGEALTAIWGADANDIFAVGTNGVHYVYYQGTWSRDQAVMGRDLQGVWGRSATEVYAVGTIDANGTGIVQRFDGSQWTDEYVAPTPLYGVWGTGSLVLAVGALGMIYGKDVGTTDWAMRLGDAGLPANPNVPAMMNEPILWGIAGADISDFAMPADVDRLFHAVNGGDFINLDPTVDRSITFRSVFAVPTNPPSYFFGTNYFGVVWLTTNGPPDAALIDDGLYTIFQDHTAAANDQMYVYGIWGTANQILFTGDQGHIYAYAASTDRFSPVASPTSAALYGAWGSSASDVWIVGDREAILHGSIPSP